MGQVRSFLTRSKDCVAEANLKWISTDKLRVRCHTSTKHTVESLRDVALVQYTSGSTSSPKGVMITHGNLIHQIESNRDVIGFNEESHSVAWVPQYHDFGLINGILTIAMGNNGTLSMFSPLAFVERPSLWLEILHRYQATLTAAPNFAFELVVRKTTTEQRAKWDLSRLTVVSAAEPILATTMQQFRDAFSVSGFRSEAYIPGYGLAEHSTAVTLRGGHLIAVDRVIFSHNSRAVAAPPDDTNPLVLVSSGKPFDGISVQIVDPETRHALPDDYVGEIWCKSPSKAAGYLNMPELTEDIFCARLADGCSESSGDGWLRTGDMGFMDDGELYVCGRLKDMMIVRGRNFYPEDIEGFARYSHPSIRPGGLVTFALDHAGGSSQDELVIHIELRGGQPDQDVAHEVATAARKAVLEGCSVDCDMTVVIGAPGLVLKTTSGKVRRRACKEQWLSSSGGPQVWFLETFTSKPPGASFNPPTEQSFKAPPSISTLHEYIHFHAAELLCVTSPEYVDPAVP
ncbi:MAG TPA: AMP-binding protein, partial [Candidatus Obscuribacterales bacterium]